MSGRKDDRIFRRAAWNSHRSSHIAVAVYSFKTSANFAWKYCFYKAVLNGILGVVFLISASVKSKLHQVFKRVVRTLQVGTGFAQVKFPSTLPTYSAGKC